MGNLAAVQKHMVAQTSGSILVRNEGGYVARFHVTYDYEGGSFTKDSGEFSLGVNKSVEIPEGASNITLKVEEAWFINSWSTIFTESFATPVKKCYKIWGTTLSPAWEETKCQ